MGETTIRVRVTQEDIDAGVRGDCTSCPVALALLRAVPGAYEAAVDGPHFDLAMVDGPNLYDVPLPRRVAWAIARFDFSGTMSPFEFDLSLPTTEAAHG